MSSPDCNMLGSWLYQGCTLLNVKMSAQASHILNGLVLSVLIKTLWQYDRGRKHFSPVAHILLFLFRLCLLKSMSGCSWLLPYRSQMRNSCSWDWKRKVCWRTTCSSFSSSKPSVEQTSSTSWRRTAGRRRRPTPTPCCRNTGRRKGWRHLLYAWIKTQR